MTIQMVNIECFFPIALFWINYELGSSFLCDMKEVVGNDNFEGVAGAFLHVGGLA